jgi:hypothetical protein
MGPLIRREFIYVLNYLLFMLNTFKDYGVCGRGKDGRLYVYCSQVKLNWAGEQLTLREI